MKKIIAWSLCAAISLSLTACAGKEQSSTPPQQEPASQTVQLANPFRDFETMEEAGEAAGFAMELPVTPDWVLETAFRTMNTQMLEVIYRGEHDEIRIRKAPGSEDISGIQSAYSESSEISVGDRTVSCQGEDGLVYAATWQDGGYSYAMTFEAGMEQADAAAMIEAVR